MSLSLTLELEERVIIGPPGDPLGYIVATQIFTRPETGRVQVRLAIQLPTTIEINRERVAASKLKRLRPNPSP